MNILFNIPLWVGVLITAIDTFTFLFIHYFGVRKLELVFGVMVTIMVGAFAVCFGISQPDSIALAEGTVYPIIGPYILLAVGTLGAVIMPHNLYLHSALVQSRKIDRSNSSKFLCFFNLKFADAISEANMYNAIESSGSLALSYFINMFVVSVFAAGFFNSPNASSIGLHAAGDVLAARFSRIKIYVIFNNFYFSICKIYLGSWIVSCRSNKYDDRYIIWAICYGRLFEIKSIALG